MGDVLKTVQFSFHFEKQQSRIAMLLMPPDILLSPEKVERKKTLLQDNGGEVSECKATLAAYFSHFY